jgi:hypothetical protein
VRFDDHSFAANLFTEDEEDGQPPVHGEVYSYFHIRFLRVIITFSHCFKKHARFSRFTTSVKMVQWLSSIVIASVLTAFVSADPPSCDADHHCPADTPCCSRTPTQRRSNAQNTVFAVPEATALAVVTRLFRSL